MTTYSELRRENQAKIDALPIKWAFSDEQFERAMAELGLTVADTDKVCTIGFCGGFCRKDDAERIRQTFAETEQALEKALEDDEFCTDAIEFELANHEYLYTYDPDEALGALGLDREDERVRRLFRIAAKRYIQKAEEEGWL